MICDIKTNMVYQSDLIKRINGLIVVNDKNQPIGALNMQDLLKAGVL